MKPQISAAASVQKWWDALSSSRRADLAERGAVVGVSGGADSLALLSALVGWRKRGSAMSNVHVVVIDHQLQPGSAAVAAAAVEKALALGATTARVIAVEVPAVGEGPARSARYEALGKACAVGELAPLPLLVAHTASDDAEGVLLGLVRGSGTRAIAGMAAATEEHPAVTAGAAWVGRPLLYCDRNATEAACRDAGVEWWSDPHNSSPDYLRSHIRTVVLPLLERELGAHIVANLMNTAHLARDDADALDAHAQRWYGTWSTSVAAAAGLPGLPCAELISLDAAVRRRVYSLWLADDARPGPPVDTARLTRTHLEAIDALVVRWRGQKSVSVPGGAYLTMRNVVPRGVALAESPQHESSVGRIAVYRVDGALRVLPV